MEELNSEDDGMEEDAHEVAASAEAAVVNINASAHGGRSDEGTYDERKEENPDELNAMLENAEEDAPVAAGMEARRPSEDESLFGNENDESSNEGHAADNPDAQHNYQDEQMEEEETGGSIEVEETASAKEEKGASIEEEEHFDPDGAKGRPPHFNYMEMPDFLCREDEMNLYDHDQAQMGKMYNVWDLATCPPTHVTAIEACMENDESDSVDEESGFDRKYQELEDLWNIRFSWANKNACRWNEPDFHGFVVTNEGMATVKSTSNERHIVDQLPTKAFTLRFLSNPYYLPYSSNMWMFSIRQLQDMIKSRSEQGEELDFKLKEKFLPCLPMGRGSTKEDLDDFRLTESGFLSKELLEVDYSQHNVYDAALQFDSKHSFLSHLHLEKTGSNRWIEDGGGCELRQRLALMMSLGMDDFIYVTKGIQFIPHNNTIVLLNELLHPDDILHHYVGGDRLVSRPQPSQQCRRSSLHLDDGMPPVLHHTIPFTISTTIRDKRTSGLVGMSLDPFVHFPTMLTRNGGVMVRWWKHSGYERHYKGIPREQPPTELESIPAYYRVIKVGDSAPDKDFIDKKATYEGHATLAPVRWPVFKEENETFPNGPKYVDLNMTGSDLYQRVPVSSILPIHILEQKLVEGIMAAGARISPPSNKDDIIDGTRDEMSWFQSRT